MMRKKRSQGVVLLALTATIVLAGVLVASPAADFIERFAPNRSTSANDASVNGTQTRGSFKRMAKPLHYNSGNSSEKVKTLPVPVAADETHKRVIFSLAVPDLLSGEILQVTSEFQVTNDLGYNVMCVSQIILAESETTVVGTEITEANGRNVTPAAHHDTFPKVGSLNVATAGTQYVNVVAWCASSRATAGATITVDADYGRLSIIRY